ncbi:hypothetical protein [Candidatus Pristimantibacillus sp. PTI5]|uniref:hypothetical protein n=1 Tax=Candidatus Pristimantibacillus sp. PTI5 TaxID=3400422 RepID=UPI003B011975
MGFKYKTGVYAAAMKLSLLCIVFLLISACGKSEKVEHIEAFATETSEQNDEGMFVRTGYKKVNAVTIIVEGKNYIKSDIKMIEDSYDLEGNFIKSEIILSDAVRSDMMMSDNGDQTKTELAKPSTILIPDQSYEELESIKLTEEQKAQVKEHVLSFVD